MHTVLIATTSVMETELCKWNWDADLSNKKQKREIGHLRGVRVLPKVYRSAPAFPTGCGLRAGREQWLCLVDRERYRGFVCT